MANEAARHLVMGTAGHVDHGKTALVRLLTGIDTDRLKEEQERGISIELGFAHLDLPSGLRVRVVNVPGHGRFVKHMLAGAGSIDFVLLVVAPTRASCTRRSSTGDRRAPQCDRGSSPSQERHGQPDLLELAEDDVRGTWPPPFAGWPIFRVSAVTGEGKDALVAAIDALAREVPARSAAGGPRLPIDRVFIMEGFGTVVTGTLWQGTVVEGQQVLVQPGARPARVRQVQVHGQKVKEAPAGQRVAVALHGLARDDIERGDWVTAPGALRESSILDVRLRAVAGGERPIRQRERLRFHLGGQVSGG
jgi:selenocysteine-specific elongation factor